MTIRDIAVAFGIEVDQKSVSAAESAIKGVKNMASKLLGAIGIGFSIAGIANLAEAAADAEALKSQFSQVFGDLEQDFMNFTSLPDGIFGAISEETRLTRESFNNGTAEFVFIPWDEWED